jgi:hypothetical protein
MEFAEDYIKKAVVPALMFGAAVFVTYRSLQIYQASQLKVLNVDVCNSEYQNFVQQYNQVPLTIVGQQQIGQYLNQVLQNYYNTLNTLGGCGLTPAQIQSYNVKGGGHDDCTVAKPYPSLFTNAPIVQYAMSIKDTKAVQDLYAMYKYIIAESAPTPGYNLNTGTDKAPVISPTCVLPYDISPGSSNITASYCWLQAEAIAHGIVYPDMPCSTVCNGCGVGNLITKLSTCPNN